MSGEIRHIELRQHLFGGLGVVVGGAADQREAGERHQRVDRGAAAVHEKGLHRRPRVEAAGEGRAHVQALRLQAGDHAVVVRGVAGEQVGPHHQQADRAFGARQAGQGIGALREAAGQAGVIEADIGIVDRRRRLDRAAQRTPRPVGVAMHQQADEVAEVLAGAAEPVLQREEVHAQVLRRAGDQPKDARQASQHRHLAGAALRLATLSALAGALAAQLLQKRQGAARGARHVEPAELGEADDLLGRQHADGRVVALAPGLDVAEDRQEMILHEQHAGDHDIGRGDRRAAALQHAGVGAPLRGGVQAERQARQLGPQLLAHLLDRPGEVGVHPHDDDVDRSGVEGRGGLQHRRRPCPGLAEKQPGKAKPFGSEVSI